MCPVCGKIFNLNKRLWVYKSDKGVWKGYYCSWSCQLIAEDLVKRAREEKENGKDK